MVKTTPIILVHGFRGAPVGLQDVQLALQELGYRNVFVPPIPPFAGSKLTDYTPTSYAQYLHDFCQQNHLSHPILIGHSMGSVITAAALQQYPDFFHTKAVLMSPISARTAAPFRLIAPLSGLLPSRIIDYITTKFMALTRDRDEFSRIMTLTHACGEIPPTKSELIQATKFSTRYSVADFPSPRNFLFLAGEHDRLIPRHQTIKLAQTFTAKTYFLPGTGHIHTYEQPQVTATVIDQFLQDCLPTSNQTS